MKKHRVRKSHVEKIKKEEEMTGREPGLIVECPGKWIQKKN
jgi:hypothetical protein